MAPPVLLLGLLLSSLLIMLSQAHPLDTTTPNASSNSYNPHPSTTKTMNSIDRCWRLDPNWALNRRTLANCVVGFGKDTLGGTYGAYYIVTKPSDDPINPEFGTLRYGAIQNEPLWIIFKTDMVITLKSELIVNSFKTIDGRSAKVEIAYGPCIIIQGVSHVIIHGLNVHDCKKGKPGLVRSSPTHLGHRLGQDGDGITIFASSNIWIDHCAFSRCFDGLVDVIHASTAITISNNYYSNHDKVMLFGHNDSFTADKAMKVTVVYNHFGPNLVQRMPRVRYGYVHVANNMYDGWEMYAIGGSANPTILSQGNYFIAPNDHNFKEVTKRESGGWENWKWRSLDDEFKNGAYFVQSGWGNVQPNYSPSQSIEVAPGNIVPTLTGKAGPLHCIVGKACSN